MSWDVPIPAVRARVTAGASYDQGSVRFVQSTQLGYLNPDRSVTGVAAFADGATGGTLDGTPLDTRVHLDSTVHTTGVYGAGTIAAGTRTVISLAARYNRAVIGNRDRLRAAPEPGSLDGRHVFHRLNPTIGFTHSLVPALNLYASYNEGSRSPTGIELGCANPAQPCRLPNAMAGDPPLEQVVTRTWEAGARSGADSALRWNAGWFRALNRNDILFVAAPQSGFGYFKNFGKTLRQGLEFGVNRRIWRADAGAGYTFLVATYQSPERVNGSANSANSSLVEQGPGFDGPVAIHAGNRIPLLPRHLLKAYANVELLSRLTVDLGCVSASSALARGNENSLHQADGTYYLGPGLSPGYVVVNAGARFRLNRRLQFFAQVNNLFDRRYYTAAQLGATGLTPEGGYVARPFAPAASGEYPLAHSTFFAPGAPLGIWAGAKVSF